MSTCVGGMCPVALWREAWPARATGRATWPDTAGGPHATATHARTHAHAQLAHSQRRHPHARARAHRQLAEHRAVLGRVLIHEREVGGVRHAVRVHQQLVAADVGGEDVQQLEAQAGAVDLGEAGGQAGRGWRRKRGGSRRAAMGTEALGELAACAHARTHWEHITLLVGLHCPVEQQARGLDVRRVQPQPRQASLQEGGRGAGAAGGRVGGCSWSRRARCRGTAAACKAQGV